MKQTTIKGVQDKAPLGDQLGIMQDIKTWICCQMIYAQTKIRFNEMRRIQYFGILRYNQIN